MFKHSVFLSRANFPYGLNLKQGKSHRKLKKSIRQHFKLFERGKKTAHRQKKTVQRNSALVWWQPLKTGSIYSLSRIIHAFL